MGGGLPIGAFIASNALMSTLTNNPILGHMNTFGGNAVCVASAQACLEVIIEENLSNRAFQIEKKILVKHFHWKKSSKSGLNWSLFNSQVLHTK